MILGYRLRELRKENKLSQEKLGKILGVSKVSVSGYESGNRIPSLEILNKILNFFDVSADYLLGREIDMVCEDGKLSITVSGVNKKTAVPYLLEKNTIDDCFMVFNEGLIIPPDQTGKLTHCYIDKEYSGTVTDYQGVKYNYDSPSGIYFEGSEYNFDISVEYINFLKGYFYTK